MIYVNDFAKHDGVLRVHFIGHAPDSFHKTDAFLIELDSHYTLIDGGMKNVTAAYEYLSKLREGLLSQMPCGMNGEGAKLRLDWMVSHFHPDHVCATLEQIIPSPLFEFDKIYLPPDSELDQKYNTAGNDDDEKYRPIFEELRKRYLTNAEIINIPFGADNTLLLKEGRLKTAILPPPGDGGKGERLRVIIDGYYKGDETARAIPVAVVNSGSVWIHLKYGRHSFLFTGDTMKREAGLFEACDEMMETYGERLGHVNVVKYPHHGLNRDNAAPLMMKFHAGWIVMTAEDATATKRIKTEFPSCRAEIVNCGNTTYVFETDGKKITVKSV